MGLVSVLTSKFRQFAAAEAEETETEQKEILDMPPDSALDHGMPVEVMKDFDTVLLFGRLTADSPKVLTIGRIPGEKAFPVCKGGSAVLVRGYDSRMAPVLLRGRVLCSSGTRCVVGELKRIPYQTRREIARYPLTPPASVCTMDDAAPDQPQPCQLLNISAGGACIVTEQPYQTGQQLRLRVELVKGAGRAAVYRCRVVRATPRSGGCFEYGLAFTQLDEGSRSALMGDIQAVREETEKKLLY